jgi:peptidoglycan/LPS O-acetylase OafA/YrhL
LQLTVVNLAFAGVLLLALLLGTSPWQGYVNSSGLRFLGYISYGLYLVHLLLFRIYDELSQLFWPQLQPRDGLFGLVVLRFVCVAGLSVGFAYLSRRFFEERFLRFKERLNSNEGWPAAGLSSSSPGSQLA